MANCDIQRMGKLGRILIEDILILKKILEMYALVLQVMDLTHLEI